MSEKLFSFDANFNFENSDNHSENSNFNWENCDREIHDYAWGAYHHEEIHCPDNSSDNHQNNSSTSGHNDTHSDGHHE